MCDFNRKRLIQFTLGYSVPRGTVHVCSELLRSVFQIHTPINEGIV